MNAKLLTVIVFAGLSVGTGCGGDDSSAVGDGQVLPTASPGAAAQRTLPRGRAPNETAPKELVVREVIEGTGPMVERGKEAVIDYVGVDYRTGKVIAVPWNDRPTDFIFGRGWVLPGIERGMRGMRAGGRRELIIPPRLAFGDGEPPRIPAHATVLYVIDLLRVE